MRVRSWTLLVVAVAFGAGGCGGGQVSGTAEGPGGTGSYSDATTVTEPVKAVRLDTDAGSVTIEGRPDARGISVRREVHNQSGRTVAGSTDVDGGVLTLHGCEPRCAIDYALVVPAGIAVRGVTTAGGITLSRVTGVDVASENGSIVLRDIDTSRISARTRNGGITGTGLRCDDIDVRTENGSMQLGITKAGNISAQTENGDVRLTVPDQPYRVSTMQDNGTIQVDVPNNPASPRHLNLQTENGPIQVIPT